MIIFIINYFRVEDALWSFGMLQTDRQCEKVKPHESLMKSRIAFRNVVAFDLFTYRKEKLNETTYVF